MKWCAKAFGNLTLFALFFVFISCTGGDGGSSSLTVTTVNEKGEPASDITVVLGNSDGSMVESATSDESGKVVFSNPPQNATVTAVSNTEYSPTSTYYFVQSYYDVRVPSITVEIGSVLLKPAGTVTLNINALPGNALLWYMDTGEVRHYIGCCADSISSTVTVYEDEILSDGTISFFILGYDFNDVPVAYGLALDQLFTDGMTVTINADSTDFDESVFLLSNVPLSATSLDARLIMDRPDGSSFDLKTEYSAPLASSVTAKGILVNADRVSHTVSLALDEDGDGIDDSDLNFIKTAPILSDQSFDFNQALAVPRNVVVSGIEAGKPAISWSESDSSADFAFAGLSEDSGDVFTSYSLIFSPSRTEITLPQLPENLSALRPQSVDSLSIAVYEYDFIADYDDYLNLIEQYYNGSYEMPSGYFGRMSVFYESSPLYAAQQFGRPHVKPEQTVHSVAAPFLKKRK